MKRPFYVETPDDHQVDRQDSQEDFAVDGVVASAAVGRAEQAFEHREVGLDLPVGAGDEVGRRLQGALQLALDHQPEGRVDNDGAIEISAKKPLFLMELER